MSAIDFTLEWRKKKIQKVIGSVLLCQGNSCHIRSGSWVADYRVRPNAVNLTKALVFSNPYESLVGAAGMLPDAYVRYFFETFPSHDFFFDVLTISGGVRIQKKSKEL